jgi:hypothetical protein
MTPIETSSQANVEFVQTRRLPPLPPVEHAIIFPLFSRLPYELRQLIWLEAYSYDTPRAYTFWLDFYREQAWQRWTDVDDVQLVPGEYGRFRSGPAALKAFTSHDRSLSACCAEARELFLKLHPDKIEFRPCTYRSRVVFGKPYSTLRFNAKRDIIILSEAVESQRFQLLHWLGTTTMVETPIHHALSTVRNLGIDTFAMLRYRNFEPQVAYPLAPTCNCAPTMDYCIMGKTDPLADFLALFPALETLHLVCSDNVLIREAVGVPIPDPPVPLQTGKPFLPLCSCTPNDADGGDKNKPVHDWPAIPAMDSDHDWFISYPERGPCPIPEPRQLARLRRRFHRHWPYYREFTEKPRFDIRILRGVVKTPLVRPERTLFRWPGCRQPQSNQESSVQGRV